MFTEFSNIIIRSLKLDKTLYKDNRNYDLGPGITDYDEVFEDDDGYPD